MMIKNKETDIIKKYFRSILENDLRHHFDRDWYDVYHGERMIHEIDAFSIDCINPHCKMRLDINESRGEYILWHRCRTIAVARLDKSNHDTQNKINIRMLNKLDPFTLCRQLRIMA